MSYLDRITKENFTSMFNLQELLKDSVFYPDAEIDGTPIECLSPYYRSFVHVDDSLTKDSVWGAMERDFKGAGYQLVGIRAVHQHELTPQGFRPLNIPFSEFEKNSLNALAARNFTACRSAPFAIWSVHELNEVFAQNPNGRPSSFSLLHIGGDSCATFDALYRQNGINPAAVAIFKHYNEWTKYSDPDCSLYKLLSYNASNNKGVSMPEHLLTDIRYGDKDTFWPGYRNPQPCRFFFGRNPYIFSLTL